MERTVEKNNVSVNIEKIEKSGGFHPPAKCKSQEKIGGFPSCSVRQRARLVMLSHRTRKQVIVWRTCRMTISFMGFEVIILMVIP